MSNRLRQLNIASNSWVFELSRKFISSMKPAKLLVMVVLSLTPWIHPVAQAQLLGFEGFSYTSGTALTGQSGGTGWLGAWTATSVGGFTVGTGLTYPGFTNSGNGIVDTSGSQFGSTRQWFDPNTTFTNGTTIWFAWLVKYTANNSSDCSVLPFGISGSSLNGYGVSVNTKAVANGSTDGIPRAYLRANGTSYGVGGSTSGVGLVGAAVAGTPFLIVGKFVLSTNANSDTLDVWVNQTIAPTNNSAMRLTGFTAARTAATSAGNLLIYSGFSSQGAVDEVAIGYSYADVTQNLAKSPAAVIDLTTPTNNTIYSAPATIAITANVATNGHVFSKVQFYGDSTNLLGEVTNAPFAVTWANVPAGVHGVFARMLYDNGLVADSVVSTVNVFSVAPVPVTVNVSSNRRAISPLIYGCNWATSNQLSELNYTLNRRGGEVESRYNWQLNAHNLCKDWYFISMRDGTGSAPGADADSTVQNTFNGGADVIITVPTMGWATKLGSGGSSLWSFSTNKYGPQTANLGDSGTGYSITNGTQITWNDKNDANYQTNSTFQAGYVQHLTNVWGTATNGGVKFYAMDNEPFLWDYTHRDVHPQTVTSNEVRDTMFDYGAMVKRIDPNAQILGAEEWGWYDWKTYYPWLLAQFQNYQNTNGTRILDYLTLHYYAGYPGAAGSLTQLLAANQSTRSLWDSNYLDQGISGSTPIINLIPTMKAWVATNYPGTKIGITEYNWNFDGQIQGAVLQAEVLGIFGREGLDMATRWGSSANNPDNIIFKAMKMYRNYDNNKSTFGDVSVSAATAVNPDDVSIFAAQRTNDNALTVMVMNKQPSGDRPVTLSLSNFVSTGVAKVWQLTSNNIIDRLNDLAVSGNAVTLTVPAQSVTLFVLDSGTPVIAGAASNPTPTNDASGIASGTRLKWSPGANATYHNVYLGTSSNAVASAVISSPEYLGVTTTTNFLLGGLAPLTTYYWRVDEQANSTATPGSVWRFSSIVTLPSVSLTNDDALNTSSFNAKLNWNDSVAPNVGNNYFTAGKILRTPNGSSGNTNFGGASLSIDAGSIFRLKGNSGSSVTVGALKLNGGNIENGNGSTVQSIYGNLNVTANSTLDTGEPTRSLVYGCAISGSANLNVICSGGTGAVAQLAGTNDTFTGNWTNSAASILQVGVGGTSGSLGSGRVINSGGLLFNRSDVLVVSNSISGAGTVSMIGGGTLTLAGTNSYTGATTVSNGTLLVNGTLGNSAVTVSNGATLGGAGVIAGAVTVRGTLAPGAGGLAKLTVSNALTLAGITLLELNKSASPSNDTVVVSGALTAGGTLVVANLGGALTNGDSFALFNKAVTGSFSSMTLPVLSGGLFWQTNLAVNGTIAVASPAVGMASNPNPTNGATGIATNVSLTWQAGANVISHQVYFGANSNAVATATIASPEFKGTQAATNYAPGTLAASGRYFWRVDEVGVANSTNGVVWTFATTVNATNKPAIGGGINGGNFAVSFPSQIGQTYRVERTDSLSPVNWQTVSNNILGTGGTIQIPDATANTSSQRFYRTIILTP